ncbi:penicillin-binding protein 3 [Salmonella enterica subsp. arizonae]|uniref:Penicillin-binding protein 3 n=1 Tax=Salmonella enterica subsp. arizonae TaxID=59203 RepID=A0A2X4TIJ9_SALER|nr:penicillin-binding protein 3 [Salmonella enterica subsp. arizonae]
MRKDRYGRVIEDISSTDSQAAHNLALSIDERLQALVYRELNNAVAFNKAESGSAVLVDVNTGEVLAMANSLLITQQPCRYAGKTRCVTAPSPTCLNGFYG